MPYIKPSILKKGDVIGICAPASPPESGEKLERGIRYLERCGYRIEAGRNIHRKHGYLAGTDKQRADDINALFSNRHVKAIFTIRGGYGSHRILPLIDYNKARQNPKILVGYSDITAIQLALLSKAKLITFSGPMVAVELAEGLKNIYEENFWRMLTLNKPMPAITGSKTNGIKLYPGISVGRLIGGNLSILTGIIGTPYFPEVRRPIYIVEEIDERPYKVDRMFQKIKLAGLFHRSAGFIVGDFSRCTTTAKKKSLGIIEVLNETLHNFREPVLDGFKYGHLRNSIYFPIGVRIRINGTTNKLEFLESGVR